MPPMYLKSEYCWSPTKANMSHLVTITLLKEHRVLGSLQAEGAQCQIHKPVAEDLVERGLAELLVHEPTEDTSDGDCGE